MVQATQFFWNRRSTKHIARVQKQATFFANSHLAPHSLSHCPRCLPLGTVWPTEAKADIMHLQICTDSNNLPTATNAQVLWDLLITDNQAEGPANSHDAPTADLGEFRKKGTEAWANNNIIVQNFFNFWFVYCFKSLLQWYGQLIYLKDV